MSENVKWIIKSKRLRVGFVTLQTWNYHQKPTWAWIHSFYLYRDKKIIQFTLFGVNIAIRYGRKPPPTP